MIQSLQPNKRWRTNLRPVDPLHDLVSRVARRDEIAFGRLYDLTKTRLFGLAMSMVRQTDAAEDVLADVYQQVWRTADRFESSRGSVMNWLFMMTRSRALDLLRSRSRLAKREVGWQEPMLAIRDTNPEQASVVRDEGSRVRQALGQVPPEQRELLVACFFTGMSHRDLSEAFELPLGTVKSRIRLGLRALRRALVDEEVNRDVQAS